MRRVNMLKSSIKIIVVPLLAVYVLAGPVTVDNNPGGVSEVKQKSPDHAYPLFIPVKVIMEENVPIIVNKKEKSTMVKEVNQADSKLEDNVKPVESNVQTDTKKTPEGPERELFTKSPEGLKLESGTKSSEDPERESRNLDNNKGENSIEREEAMMQKLNTKCSSRDISSCIILKLVTFMNKLLKKTSIHVADGLEITQTTAVVENIVEPESARRLDGEDDDDETSQLTNFVTSKVWSFVKSRSLRWNLFPAADIVVSANPDNEGTLNVGMSIRAARALNMARGRKNNLGPLLAAAIMKLGLVGGLAFKTLALLVGKALILSKIAFLLGAVLWLKKLFSQQKHYTYEVMAHPHHTHSHAAAEPHHGDSYASGWARKLGLAAQSSHNIAYRAHASATKQ